MTKIIHWRIAKVARELAIEAYEVMAKENAFYERHRSMKRYVERHWNEYIPFARQAMAMILAKDYSHEIASGQHSQKTVDDMKQAVYEALLIDGAHKASPQIGEMSPMNAIPA